MSDVGRGRECGATRAGLSCVLRPHLSGFHVGSSFRGLSTWRDGYPENGMAPKRWTDAARQAAEEAHAALVAIGAEGVVWVALSSAEREQLLEVAMAVENVLSGGRAAPPLNHEPLAEFALAVQRVLRSPGGIAPEHG